MSEAYYLQAARNYGKSHKYSPEIGDDDSTPSIPEDITEPGIPDFFDDTDPGSEAMVFKAATVAVGLAPIYVFALIVALMMGCAHTPGSERAAVGASFVRCLDYAAKTSYGCTLTRQCLIDSHEDCERLGLEPWCAIDEAASRGYSDPAYTATRSESKR